MSDVADLQRIVDAWASEPDHGVIRHVLSTSSDRHHLATLCAAAQLPLPEDLVDLVLELVDSDPLMQLTLDSLMESAMDPESGNLRKLGVLAELILERPDSLAFQRILADDIVDALFDDETDTPTHVKDRLARVACELVVTLPHPAFAPVLLAGALTSGEPDQVARDLRLCWERAVQLPDDDLYWIALDAADLVDVATDPELAVAVAHTVLRLAPEVEPAHVDPAQTASVRLLLFEALAQTDRLEAVDLAESMITQDPSLADSDVAASWTMTLLSHLLDLAQRDAPGSVLLGLADRLAAHREWWPEEEHTPTYVALVLARVYLAGNAPLQAEPWCEYAADHPAEIEDFPAEAAMLRVNVALQLGRTEELPALLRASAQAVADAKSDEYRLAWGAIVEATAMTNRDQTLADSANQGSADVVRDLVGRVQASLALGGDMPADGPPADEVLALFTFATELKDLHERFISQVEPDVRLRDAAVELCRRIPTGQPQLFIGAHMYACVGEFGLQNAVGARHHLDELSAELRRQRLEPVGGFPIVVAEQVESVFRVGLADVSGSPFERSARLRELRELREENEVAGRAHMAYLLSRGLMQLYVGRGDFVAATDEGIRALSFHARRAVTTPDARERAALHEDFSEIAAGTFRAALSAGRPRVAAEILEVVRAQPVPFARMNVPRTEQSLMGLVSELLSPWTPAGEPAWSGTWSAAGVESPVPEAGTGSPVEESALLLAGLPSIIMPWGPALDDRLRDITSSAAVRVVVSRGEVGT